MSSRAHAPVAVGVGVLLLPLLAGCAQGGRSHGECLPGPLTASPNVVRAGQTFRLTSAGFACRRHYLPGHKYSIQLGLAGREAAKSLGDIDVAQNGSVDAVLRIPAQTSPGEAFVIVSGSPFDDCRDVSGSCAGYTTSLTVLPPR